MSKAQRLYWSLGSFGVCASILENAWTAHTQSKFSKKDKAALNQAVHIQMLNGLGLCLLGTRKYSRVSMLPAPLLCAGSILFPGTIFYTRIYDDQRFLKLNIVPTLIFEASFVMVGGVASILGWFFMAFC